MPALKELHHVPSSICNMKILCDRSEVLIKKLKVFGEGLYLNKMRVIEGKFAITGVYGRVSYFFVFSLNYYVARVTRQTAPLSMKI